MVKRVKRKVNIILIISFTFLSVSCKKEMNGIIIYESFNFQKLEPVLKLKSNSNWYVKGVYSRDSLNSVIFLRKKNNYVLKKDSVYHLKKREFFINNSKIEYNSISFDLVKITFIKGLKIQRHFLVKNSKKYYLLAVEKQTKSFEFEMKRINTNSYCLEFDNIEDYLKNIEISENSKFYFTDFLSFEILYKNEKAFYKETLHFDWGNANSPNFSVLSNAYGNLYLDLDNYEKSNYFMDSSSLKCLK